MDPADRRDIAGVVVFGDLTSEELDSVLADARVATLEEGQQCFAQGEAADCYFLLLSGRIKVTQLTPEGLQVVILVVGPGELFGLAAAIGLASYPGTAVAATACRVVQWPSSSWARLAAAHPAVAAVTMRIMGRRMQEMHTRLREISTERVEQRIAHALLRLVRQSGRAVDAGVMIDFPVTRQDIAEMTGSTLHTVSRTLAAWEASGVLEGGRRRIVVRDSHALVRLAGE